MNTECPLCNEATGELVLMSRTEVQTIMVTPNTTTTRPGIYIPYHIVASKCMWFYIPLSCWLGDGSDPEQEVNHGKHRLGTIM